MDDDEMAELWQEVESLKERMNALTQAKGGTGGVEVGGGGEPVEPELAEQVSKLDRRLQEIEASGGSGDVDVAQSPAFKGLDERLYEVESDVADLEDYVYEWTETAQTYLLAIRRVIEEKFDLNMRSYLDAVAAEKRGAENDAGADREQLD